MLSPPRSKKLSSMPTRGRPRTRANRSTRVASRAVRGGAPAARPAKSGAGSAARSSLPLAVRGRRVQHHDRGRDHVVGQAGGRVGAHRGGEAVGRGGADRGHDVGDEAGDAGRVGPGGHRDLADGRVGGEGRLDLAELDPVAPHLDLVVGPPDERRWCRRRVAADHVARAVHAGAGRAERVGHEALGRQPGPAEVAAGELAAAQVQLARRRRAAPAPGRGRGRRRPCCRPAGR